MYRIIPTARFRKDLKRAAKRGLPMEQLENVVDPLSLGKTLAPKYRDHALTGNYGITDKFSTAILAYLFRPLCVDKSST